MLRAMRAASRILIGATCCLTLSLACVSAEGSRYAYFLAPGMEGSAQARHWLVLPMSALDALPDFLVAPAGRLQEELRAHLEGAGRSVKPLAQSKLLESTRKMPNFITTEEDPVPDEMLAALTRVLAKSNEFDVAAYPELVVEPVHVPQGRTGVWHGVRRNTRVIRGEDAPEGIFSMSGKQPGASLRMRVFARDGTKHFESYGGLDFLQEARVSGYRFYMEIRPDVLSDRAILREGVQLALTPYVPAPALVESH
jgi:hypothetical protein